MGRERAHPDAARRVQAPSPYRTPVSTPSRNAERPVGFGLDAFWRRSSSAIAGSPEGAPLAALSDTQLRAEVFGRHSSRAACFGRGRRATEGTLCTGVHSLHADDR